MMVDNGQLRRGKVTEESQGKVYIVRGYPVLYPKRLGFRYLVRVIFLYWQGEMTSNSRSIARNFNAARTEIGQQ